MPDEKRRGISIELGFAELPEAGISFIDVPGHKKLVHAMIAGVGGVDGVLCAVAADDGVMPQTREHLHICKLLGIRRVVVALTKADLVDAEMLELAEADIRSTLEALGLEAAAVVPTAIPSGQGAARAPGGARGAGPGHAATRGQPPPVVAGRSRVQREGRGHRRHRHADPGHARAGRDDLGRELARDRRERLPRPRGARPRGARGGGAEPRGGEPGAAGGLGGGARGRAHAGAVLAGHPPLRRVAERAARDGPRSRRREPGDRAPRHDAGGRSGGASARACSSSPWTSRCRARAAWAWCCAAFTPPASTARCLPEDACSTRWPAPCRNAATPRAVSGARRRWRWWRKETGRRRWVA
ncbi:MAG: hypothetical protein IPM35_29440 [Myxococcales bacterium]|nr:hypothetical protein [Myxococcales bacterium]